MLFLGLLCCTLRSDVVDITVAVLFVTFHCCVKGCCNVRYVLLLFSVAPMYVTLCT